MVLRKLIDGIRYMPSVHPEKAMLVFDKPAADEKSVEGNFFIPLSEVRMVSFRFESNELSFLKDNHGPIDFLVDPIACTELYGEDFGERLVEGFNTVLLNYYSGANPSYFDVEVKRLFGIK